MDFKEYFPDFKNSLNWEYDLIHYLETNNIFTDDVGLKHVLVKNMYCEINSEAKYVFNIFGKQVRWLDMINCTLPKSKLIELLNLMPNIEMLTISGNIYNYKYSEILKDKNKIKVRGYVISIYYNLQ